MVSLGLEGGVFVWYRPVSTGLALALCPNCHVINKEPTSHFPYGMHTSSKRHYS